MWELESKRNRETEAVGQKMQAGTKVHFHGLDTYSWDMGVPVFFAVNYNYV